MGVELYEEHKETVMLAETCKICAEVKENVLAQHRLATVFQSLHWKSPL
jgi:hypothetical protein